MKLETQRIALLFEYPTLNGGERSMLQSIMLVDPGEFEIVALAPSVGPLAETLRARGIPHVPFELRDDQDLRLPRAQACRRLVETLDEVKPALLHANSLSMGRLTGAIAEQLTIPSVAHLRDIIGLSRAAIRDLNRNQQLIAVSHATRDFHVENGMSVERTCVVHNGVDSQHFRPRPKTHALCRQLGIPDESFVLLTVGQIGLRKGQDVLAAAATRIAEHVPLVQFVIVGQRNSTKAETVAFESNLRATFARAGLADRFHLLGYRDDVEQLMNEADLLVHPAKQEPLGRVLLEAAAAGLPIVATDVGGTSEIVTEGESARLVAPGDDVPLADAVIQLASDTELRARLAEAARQRVTQDFTPRRAADGLMDVWRAVLA